jgi:uncharacterized membrane protein YhhN
MSDPVAAALVAASLVAVVDWIAIARDGRRLERLAKPGVMALLIVAVILAGPGSSAVRWLLIGALAASLAGDWLLLPPVTTGRFTAGLAAFLAAHVGYLAVFLLGDLQAGPAALGALAAGVLLVTAGRPILAGARRVGLGGPVVAYFGAICLMAIAATASGSAPAMAGAWLFVASDTLLGSDRFAAPPAVTRSAAAHRRLAVIVTYHAAQVLLTVAILGTSVS